MDAIQLQEFKHTLEQLLAGLEDPFLRREEIAVENTPDALDQVQNAADRALAIRQLELDFNRMRSLKDALAAYRGWQLWDMPSVRCGDQPEAAKGRSVGGILHRLPGSRRPRRERGRKPRRVCRPGRSPLVVKVHTGKSAAKNLMHLTWPPVIGLSREHSQISAPAPIRRVKQERGDAKRADETGGN